MNCLEFFNRLVEEMGYCTDSEIKGLQIRFNSGTTIIPVKYLGAGLFGYVFGESNRVFEWDFNQDDGLSVRAVSCKDNSLKRIKRASDYNTVIIDIISGEPDEEN